LFPSFRSTEIQLARPIQASRSVYLYLGHKKDNEPDFFRYIWRQSLRQ
jgi:hypothetical protein